MNPLRMARRALGKTQEQIAKELKVSPTSIHMYEQGVSPRPDRIPKLARAYGLSANELAKFFEMGAEMYARLMAQQMAQTGTTAA